MAASPGGRGFLAAPVILHSQQAPQTFPTSTELVLLDLVARDKNGRLVTDLRPDELEVLEDGKPASIVSFRLVRAGTEAGATDAAAPAADPGAPPGAGSTTPSTSPLRETLLVLVFDRLSPDAATLARAAATDFVKRPFPAGTWVAVLEIGTALRLTGSLTQDLGQVPAAIASATAGSHAPEPTQGGDQANATREATTAALVATLNPVGVDGIDPVAAARIRAPKDRAELKQIEMQARILTEVDSLNRQRLGSNALYALLALADAFTGVEGRKTVLLFSEGLPVPEAVADVLDRVVSQANRANLTLYAFDARGLAPEGGFEESKRALLAARHLSERAMRSTGSEEGPTRGVSPVEVQAHSLALDAIRLNGQANLRDLAESTGGFLVAETNDLAAAMERVGADLRSYYEIAYVPANAVADGAFRGIEVKVRRRGVAVRTRRGYFALPPGVAPAFPYELALASALGQQLPPHDFDHAVTTSVADGPGERKVRVEVRVPLAALRFETDEVQGAYRAHFSVLALVRDAGGALVTQLSHDWPMSGPSSEIARVRERSATVTRELALPPGSYGLETAVLDRLGGSRSTHRAQLDVGF